MECNVCLNEWDEQKCVPRMLPCGHSYCGECLSLLYKPSSGDLACPKCMASHKLVSLSELTNVFPKNWALIALADSHKPTAPLLQMRMGTPQKSKTNLRSKLFQSLSASGNLQVLYTSRTRGNSDNLLSNSSTLMSALSGSMHRSGDNQSAIDEEYKSEDEMRRVLSETSEDEEESCKSEREGSMPMRKRHRPAGKSRQNRTADKRKEFGLLNPAQQESQSRHSSDASEVSDAQSNQTDDGQEPFLEPGAMCSLHQLKVHSWHKVTRKHLCTYCIQTQNLANEEVQIYPQAVREIKSRMLEAKELNKLRKMQLTQVMSHLTEGQRRNRQAAENKLTSHLTRVKKLMEDYEVSCKMQLAQAFKKQDLKVASIEHRISEDLDQLCNDDISLQSMFDHDDLLLVYMTQAVDNLYSKTVNFRPSIENFEDLVVKVEIEADAATRLKTALTDSHQITFDALRDEEQKLPASSKSKSAAAAPKNEEAPQIQEEGKIDAEKNIEPKKAPLTTVESLFSRDEHWLCTSCGQRQEAADIICTKCLKFKPITFYPNLAHNPAEVTNQELKAIHRRRKLERKLLIEADKAGQSLQGQSTVWFIISNKWLYKWKCFIQNQVTLNNFFDNEEWAASITLSNNSEIGVLPPGLISNKEDLFDDMSQTELDQGVANPVFEGGIPGLKLKTDLRVNINYRAVSPFVWYLFFVNYGGLAGAAQVPQLPREAIDIYSRDMSKLIKIYWGEGRILPQTKMQNLQALGKDIINRYMQKKKKKNSKDGSGSSHRRKEKKLAEQTGLLLNAEERDEVDFSSRSEVVGVSNKMVVAAPKRQSATIMSKLKQCAYPSHSSTSSVTVLQRSTDLNKSQSSCGLYANKSAFSQIEQLLSDDNDLQFSSPKSQNNLRN